METIGLYLGRVVGGYAHWCRACRTMHRLAAPYVFDGDSNRPTFKPDIRIERASGVQREVCHYIINRGLIQFLDDCTHEMRGRLIPLTVLPRLVIDNPDDKKREP